MNNEIEFLLNRRSCKSFIEGERLPDDIINQILTAGTFAPTGKGNQSPQIVLVNDDKTVKELSKLNASFLNSNGDPFYGAPTVAIVFADKNYFTHIEDGSLVMGNMLNAASALNVGACWIHRAKEMFETEEGKAFMKKWGIGEQYVGIGNCVLGYRKNPPLPSKPRKTDYIVKV